MIAIWPVDASATSVLRAEDLSIHPPACIPGPRIVADPDARRHDPPQIVQPPAQRSSRITSMQCYVDPDEIADLIVFLYSDAGRHISGQIIGVDGNTETLYPRS